MSVQDTLPAKAGVVLLNFGHPLTDDHLAQTQTLGDLAIDRVIGIPTQFDPHCPFPDQVRKLVGGLGLSTTDWQTLPILINPPPLNVISVTLLAELHGRMGYFPAILRLRPVASSMPTRFEVAEIINLQQVRDTARTRRGDG